MLPDAVLDDPALAVHLEVATQGQHPSGGPNQVAGASDASDGARPASREVAHHRVHLADADAQKSGGQAPDGLNTVVHPDRRRSFPAPSELGALDAAAEVPELCKRDAARSAA